MSINLINIELDTEPFIDWFQRAFLGSESKEEPLSLRDLDPWLMPRGRSNFIDEKDKAMRNPDSAKVISLVNLKGGVGKSTIAANLGATLADRGKRVLLIDLDWQESLSHLTLTPSVAHEFRASSVPAIAKVFETYAQNPFEPNWNSISARAEAIVVERECRNDGILAVLPTTQALQTMEEIAKMSHFWSVKQPVKKVEDLQAIARAVFDSRFIVAEMITKWTEGFDYIIADCPPRLTPSSIGAFAASDLLLMPTQRDHVSKNGVTLFIRRFLEDFSKLLWGPLQRLPEIRVVMNHVFWLAESRARREVNEYVDGLNVSQNMRFESSQAVVPTFKGFLWAQEDRSDDRRVVAIDHPNAGNRLLGQMNLLADEVAA